MENASAIECLNGLLRGEISAVETYNQARERNTLPGITPLLEEGQLSHHRRVQKLVKFIKGMGGEPSADAGPWGAFANFLESSAGVLGDKASIDMLEQGEDHGLKVYRDELESCTDPIAHAFIKEQLLPAQEETHSVMANLKHTMH